MDDINEVIARTSRHLSQQHLVSIPVGLGSKRELKEDYTQLIEGYIDETHRIYVYSRYMHEGIVSYLRAIPHHAPIRTIVLGQNSYKEEVLPRYASALAYSIYVCAQPPPSVEVMAKALAEVSDEQTYEDWVSLLRNSYLFLQRSAAFLNVVPYSEAGDVERLMMSTLMSKLIIDLCKINLRYGFNKLSLFCLGSPAEDTVSRVSRSMSQGLRSKVHLNVSHSMNPAFLSYHNSKYEEEHTLVSLSRVTRCDSLNGAKPSAVGTVPTTQRISYTSHKYPTKHINHVITEQVAKRLAKLLWDNRFKTKVTMHNSDESSTETYRSTKKPSFRPTERRHIPEVSGDSKTSYALSVVIKAAELLATHQASIEATSRAATEMVRKVGGSRTLTAEEIGEAVTRLEGVADDLTKLSTLCAGIHATFESCSPLVQSSSSSMPPIVSLERTVSEPRASAKGREGTHVSAARSTRKTRKAPVWEDIPALEAVRTSYHRTHESDDPLQSELPEAEDTPVTPSRKVLNSDEETDEEEMDYDRGGGVGTSPVASGSVSMHLLPGSPTTAKVSRESEEVVNNEDSDIISSAPRLPSSLPGSRTTSRVSSAESVRRGKGKGKKVAENRQVLMV